MYKTSKAFGFGSVTCIGIWSFTPGCKCLLLNIVVLKYRHHLLLSASAQELCKIIFKNKTNGDLLYSHSFSFSDIKTSSTPRLDRVNYFNLFISYFKMNVHKLATRGGGWGSLIMMR